MIRETRRKYAGLVTREKAEQLAYGARYAVKKVFAPKKFANGVFQRTVLEENGKEKTLVLWNDETRFAGKALRAGTVVGLKNFYEKNGELHSTKNLQVSVIREAEPLPLLDGEPQNFSAFVTEKSGGEPFKLVVAGKTRATVNCWDSNLEVAEKSGVGERVCFEGARWSEGEANAGWDCLVYPCQGPAAGPGEIKKEGVCEGRITALYEARQTKAKGVLALIGAINGERTAFFGADAETILDADCDLPPETILELKRRYIKGKTIVFVAHRAGNGLTCKQLLKIS
ncbi:hypothetical protein COT57_00665 [Candidatus Micrarchaeota archaeon CG09_land_8_20_14_0_10_55_25]|nr:MAG: hypothetical protein COT57_00665 [Candidatus Micrarchaeota archaeon CG09_land_8_20_14_0_10_55_25]